jgi:hypothetical protein
VQQQRDQYCAAHLGLPNFADHTETPAIRGEKGRFVFLVHLRCVHINVDSLRAHGLKAAEDRDRHAAQLLAVDMRRRSRSLGAKF